MAHLAAAAGSLGGRLAAVLRDRLQVGAALPAGVAAPVAAVCGVLGAAAAAGLVVNQSLQVSGEHPQLLLGDVGVAELLQMLLDFFGCELAHGCSDEDLH